jgi:hypothetical protein
MRLVLVLAGLAVLPVRAEGAALAVVCSVDAPIAGPHENVRANVYVLAPEGETLQYAWKASGGALDGKHGPEVTWNPNGAAAGTFRLSVDVTGSGGDAGNCSATVIASSSERSAPAYAGVNIRQIRPAMLIRGKSEEEHYGLYSYMLLGSRLSGDKDPNRERYTKFLQAYVQHVQKYDGLKRQLPPQQLNISYLPVVRDVPPSMDENWILDHYDFETSIELLQRFPGRYGDGPFIISVPQPLSRYGQLSDPRPRLIEDLSTVPVNVIDLWVKQFLVQTAQDRWDSATLSGLALRVRTAIEVAAIGSKEVRASLPGLFKLGP